MSDQSQGNGPIFNPALGGAAAPIHMPTPPASQAPQAPQGGQPSGQGNPYATPNPYSVPNPYAPQAGANPYGEPQQSPYIAPPQVTPQSAPPAQGGNPFNAPAYNFNPAYPPAPTGPNVYPFQPAAPLPAQGLPNPQSGQSVPFGAPPVPPQVQQPHTAPQTQPQQAAQLPEFTPDQVQQMFPDETSRAIYTGIQALASAHKVDVLQAFETAYVTKDPQHINERYLAQFDPNVVAQLKGQFNALVGVERQREQQTIQTVHQLAGGEAQWKAAASVFNQAVPPEQCQVMAELLNSGDPAKVQFAAQQVLAFAAQSGRTIARNPNSVQNPGAGNGAGQMLTKGQFFQQLDLLAQAHQPGTPEYDRHYKALLEQRQIAKTYGY